MATNRGKNKQIQEERETISKIAFGIIVALCVQIVVYLVLLNIIPHSIKEPVVSQNNIKLYYYEDISGIYKEKWPTYIGYDINGDGKIGTYTKEINDNGEPKLVQLSEWGAIPNKDGMKPVYSSDLQVDNGMQFIFGYNMTLLLGSTLLVIWYFLTILEEKTGFVTFSLREFFKKNKALFFLFLFMIWTLISSLLAIDLHRSFIGCYNLRDGYLSFMFYASMLINVLLLGKNKDKEKRKIVDFFLITGTLLAILVAINYYANLAGYSVWPTVKRRVRYKEFILSNQVQYLVQVEPPIIPEILSGIFNNLNHYAYYLSIAVIVATIMTVIEEKVWKKIAYFLSYIIMVYVLILNNTFGSYLGVIISLACLYIYQIVTFIIKPKNEKVLNESNESAKAKLTESSKNNENKNSKSVLNENLNKKLGKEFAQNIKIKNKMNEIVKVLKYKLTAASNLITTAILFIIFMLLSLKIVDEDGKVIAIKNFEETGAGIKTIISSINKKENTEQIDNFENNSTENLDEKKNNEDAENNLSESDSKLKDVGSGRWGIWSGFFKIIKQHPIFGVGLENMLYRMDELTRLGETSQAEGRSHNLLIQLAATTGIPGMIFYSVGIAIIFFAALKRIKYWNVYTCMGFFVMISYLISSMTGNSGFYTSGYFYIFVGFVVVGIWEIDEKRGKDDK